MRRADMKKELDDFCCTYLLLHVFYCERNDKQEDIV